MKACDYCGWENEAAMVSCGNCGKSLLVGEPPFESVPSVESVQPQLRAGSATIIFLVFFGVQIFVGAVVAAIAILIAFGRLAGDSSGDPEQTVQSITPPVAFFSVIAGGVAMVLASLAQARDGLRDTSSTGAAWVIGSRTNMLMGLGVGVACSLFYFAIALIHNTLWPAEPSDSMGPITRMAITPGISQSLWIALALLLAPPFEELLFRGVLYGGYRRSFGPIRAAILTTALFVSLHVSEMIYYWPSVIGITGIALAALWVRLRSAAIGPAIAAHIGYNAIIVLQVLYS